MEWSKRSFCIFEMETRAPPMPLYNGVITCRLKYTVTHFVKKKFLLPAVILRAPWVRSRLRSWCLALTMRCYVFKSWYHTGALSLASLFKTLEEHRLAVTERFFFFFFFFFLFDEYVAHDASLKFSRARRNNGRGQQCYGDSYDGWKQSGDHALYTSELDENDTLYNEGLVAVACYTRGWKNLIWLTNVEHSK